MPRGDRTGQSGMGSMTGRAAGYCAGYTTPGFMNSIPGNVWGMGYGRGRGRGRGVGIGMGWRHGFVGAPYPVAAYPAPYAASVTPQNEIDVLRDQATYLGKTLEGINKRIAELENGK